MTARLALTLAALMMAGSAVAQTEMSDDVNHCPQGQIWTGVACLKILEYDHDQPVADCPLCVVPRSTRIMCYPGQREMCALLGDTPGCVKWLKENPQ
jgi:hypothetical protein